MASVLTTECIPLFYTLCTSFKIYLYLISLYYFSMLTIRSLAWCVIRSVQLRPLFVRVQPVFLFMKLIHIYKTEWMPIDIIH